MAMSEEHKLTLKRLRKTFVENLEIDLVLDELVSNNIITYEDEDRIQAGKTTGEKIRTLLRLLPRKGDKAFGVLYASQKDKPWLQKMMVENQSNPVQGTYDASKRYVFCGRLQICNYFGHILRNC